MTSNVSYFSMAHVTVWLVFQKFEETFEPMCYLSTHWSDCSVVSATWFTPVYGRFSQSHWNNNRTQKQNKPSRFMTRWNPLIRQFPLCGNKVCNWWSWLVKLHSAEWSDLWILLMVVWWQWKEGLQGICFLVNSYLPTSNSPSLYLLRRILWSS